MDGGAHYVMTMCGQGLPGVLLTTAFLRGTEVAGSREGTAVDEADRVYGDPHPRQGVDSWLLDSSPRT